MALGSGLCPSRQSPHFTDSMSDWCYRIHPTIRLYANATQFYWPPTNQLSVLNELCMYMYGANTFVLIYTRIYTGPSQHTMRSARHTRTAYSPTASVDTDVCFLCKTNASMPFSVLHFLIYLFVYLKNKTEWPEGHLNCNAYNIDRMGKDSQTPMNRQHEKKHSQKCPK